MVGKKNPVSVELALSAFDEFREDYPGMKRSEQFELFTAFCNIRGYELDSQILESGRVGFGSDGGIDWLYLSINGRLVNLTDPVSTNDVSRNTTIELIIGQAKEEQGWKASVGEKLALTFNDLFGSGAAGAKRNYAPDLKVSVDNFLNFWYEAAKKRPTLFLRIFQSSLGVGSPHGDVEKTMELAADELSTHFRPVRASWSIQGAQDLFDLYSTMPSYDASLKYVEELEQGDDKIALVRLSDYVDFLSGEDGSLNEHFFEDNVRDYEGGVQVNGQILSTLNSPDVIGEFWWLNNGITMLVSEPPVSSRKEYSLRDVQIVNGLQTSQTIYRWAQENNAAKSDRRTVLVRIIAPESEDDKSRIIRATNNQTPVAMASLRATDQVHRKIEDFFGVRGLFYDRRKNYHKNHGRPQKDIVSIKMLSQAMMSAFLFRPDTARARPSSFLNSDDTYSDIFEHRSLEEFYWAASTQKFVDEVLASEELTSSMRNNVRFYVLSVMRALGSSARANHAIWSSTPCEDDWAPSKTQVAVAAHWIINVAMNLQAETPSADAVFKGSKLKEALEADWANVFPKLNALA